MEHEHVELHRHPSSRPAIIFRQVHIHRDITGRRQIEIEDVLSSRIVACVGRMFGARVLFANCRCGCLSGGACPANTGILNLPYSAVFLSFSFVPPLPWGRHRLSDEHTYVAMWILIIGAVCGRFPGCLAGICAASACDNSHPPSRGPAPVCKGQLRPKQKSTLRISSVILACRKASSL